MFAKEPREVSSYQMIPCLGHQCGNPLIGYDYDCDYEFSGEFGCEDCICNSGRFDPRTGKVAMRIYKE